MLKKDEHMLVVMVGVRTTKVALMKSLKCQVIFVNEYHTKLIHELHKIIDYNIENAKEHCGVKVTKGVIGAACALPRARNRIESNDISLTINKSEILQKSRLKELLLLNDYEAVAYGLDILDLSRHVIRLPHMGDDLTAGHKNHGIFAVIGAKSNLGMAVAFSNCKCYSVIPSQGGQISLTAQDTLALGLITYLKKHVTKHPTFQTVLSKAGMEHIFNYLASLPGYSGSVLVKKIKKLKGTDKRTLIGENYQRNKACRKTIDMFLSYYAEICRDLALSSLCYGGLFLTDMLALRDIKNLNHKNQLLKKFMRSYEQQDIMGDALKKIPVYLIRTRNLDLKGACIATKYL